MQQQPSAAIPIPLVPRHFISGEIEALENKLRELIALQRQNEANLRAKFAEASRNGFLKRTTEELTAFDREDERLGTEILRLETAYAEAVVNERRQQITAAIRKTGNNDMVGIFSGKLRTSAGMNSSGGPKYVIDRYTMLRLIYFAPAMKEQPYEPHYPRREKKVLGMRG